MGRFDVLTHLDRQPEKTLSSQEKPAKPQEGKTTKPQTILPESPQAGKPVNQEARKTTKDSHFKPASEEREKYTTRLRPSMVKHVKVFAAQQDIKDYEVVEKALIEYFEKNK